MRLRGPSAACVARSVGGLETNFVYWTRECWELFAGLRNRIEMRNNGRSGFRRDITRGDRLAPAGTDRLIERSQVSHLQAVCSMPRRAGRRQIIAGPSLRPEIDVVRS